MGLFTKSRVKPTRENGENAGDGGRRAGGNDVARMFAGRPVKEMEAIEQAERALREQQQNAFEQERKAVNEVAERERQMLAHIASMQAQLQESNDELERARKTEEDLHKALRLAAERLSGANTNEGGMRAELDETKMKLHDAQLEVNHLRARLYGEKGLRLDTLTLDDAQQASERQRGSNHDDEVIASLVTGAVPAARDGANMAEERQLASRHSREQVKRLLHFAKKQLADDLAQWRGYGDAPPAELTDQIGKERALAEKLEGALHELLGNNALAHGGGVHGSPKAGGGGGGAGGANSFAVKVAGGSLPRTVAVNDSTIRAVLTASGPATRWVLKPHDPPAGWDPSAAASAEDELSLDWSAGETLMLVVEAVDETGMLDEDFDAVLLLECDDPHVHGRGLVRVARGRGLVPMHTNVAGEALVSLQDGGFFAMEQPSPIRVTFRGSAAAAIHLQAEELEATAGDGVSVTIEARDRFGNVATDVTCDVTLSATHGASWGDEPVKLEQGSAVITLTSEVAATVALSVVEVSGAPQISEHGLSGVCQVRYAPGPAAYVQLNVANDDEPRVAGVRAKLLLEVADRYGNGVLAGSSNLAADLKVVPGPIGNARVERDGQCAIADGMGEVWVSSETAKEPTHFWLEAAGGGASVGGLAIRHTEDEPFEAMWTAGAVAQFGLYLPSAEPVRVGGERMSVGVRTEDNFGNPAAGFDGRVLVISHAEHVRFVHDAQSGGKGCKVTLANGDGRLECTSDVAEPFQLSLQDIARHGLRTASVLRATFRPLSGVRAVFGDVGDGLQRVGFPYPLPLLVLDRLGNVADEHTGETAVRMSGAARVAGRAPEIFKIVGGRATLPVLTTIAETVTFTLGEHAILDPVAVEKNAAVQGHPMTATITFVASETQRLVLAVTAAEGANTFGREALENAAAAPAAADVAAPRPGSALSNVTAGTDVLVTVRAIDAYNNVVPSSNCTVFLEAELKPTYDDALTNANLPPASEPAQKYLLTLSGGEAKQRVPTRVAGELKLQLKEPNQPNLDLTSRARVKIVPSSAVSIDVINMPEAGRAGVEFQFLVRALDQFGNVDESFERDVTLDSDNAPPGMQLENDGRVKLVKGMAKARCTLLSLIHI